MAQLPAIFRIARLYAPRDQYLLKSGLQGLYITVAYNALPRFRPVDATKNIGSPIPPFKNGGNIFNDPLNLGEKMHYDEWTMSVRILIWY